MPPARKPRTRRTHSPPGRLNPVRDLANELLDLVLPPKCHLCDNLASPAHGRLLCTTCASGWREVVPACPACGRPDEDLDDDTPADPPTGGSTPLSAQRCTTCLQDPWAFDRARSLYAYEDKIAEAIRALKYRRRAGLARWLGQAMAQRIPTVFRDTAYTGVVPVPLHWTRFWSRGFNQAELLARPVAQALDVPVQEAVYRVRATRKQARLGKADRQDNLEHAFAVRPRVRFAVQDATLLLIDDVFTTGATTSACAAVLKEAGARHVDVFTLARTP